MSFITIMQQICYCWVCGNQRPVPIKVDKL